MCLGDLELVFYLLFYCTEPLSKETHDSSMNRSKNRREAWEWQRR
jgi:hypothetical protein